MTNHRLYISASTQKGNVGVGAYGTEQDRMQYLADRIKYWLETQKGRFTIFRNKPGWTLQQTVDDCNKLDCEAFADYHSDAGPVEQIAGDGGAEGTTAFYYGPGGTTSNSYRLASLLYKYAAPLSLGVDRGVKADSVLYASGLFVIRNTDPAAALIEMLFHTNVNEVNNYLSKVELFAREQAKAWCEYCGEKWEEHVVVTPIVLPLPKPTWEHILDKVSTNPIEWKEAITVAVNAAKADGNLGVLEIFQYLPELLVKAYEAK